MAYITTEEVAVIRANIKKAFPVKDGWKFSVTKNDGGLKVGVALTQYPADYMFPDYVQLNHYHISRHGADIGLGEREIEVMETVHKIVTENHWDESDVQSDYFNVAFYYYIHIGRWNKPAVKKG